MLVLIFMAIPVAVLTIILILFVLFHTVYLPCCGHEGYMKDGLAVCLKRLVCGLCCCCCCRYVPLYSSSIRAAPAQPHNLMIASARRKPSLLLRSRIARRD